MLFYLSIFFIPILAQFTIPRLETKFHKYLFFSFSVLLFTIIALRHEVGGDWFNYLDYFYKVKVNGISYNSFFLFDLINVASDKLHLNVYGTNIFLSGVFIYGLTTYALKQKFPWLILIIAFPYLVTVVGMGFSRQAAGFACVVLAILALTELKNAKFFLYIFIAVLFHYPSLIFLGLIAVNYTKLFSSKRFLIYLVTSIVILAIVYQLLISESIGRQLYHYIGAGQHLQSKGAIFRALINLLPAFIFLFNKDKFSKNDTEKGIFTILSLLAILNFFICFVASTFSDRIGYYLIILQLYVFSNIFVVFKDIRMKQLSNLVVIFFYTALFSTWLTFSNHIASWVPYKMFPFSKNQTYVQIAIFYEGNTTAWNVYDLFIGQEDMGKKAHELIGRWYHDKAEFNE